MSSQPDSDYILIVEDDADLRGIEAEVIRASGHEVRTAGDGIEALEVMDAAGAPAVIVLDLRMPRMNGWDFAARIRADLRWHTVPIVVVAAHYAIGAEAAALRARAWLHKPVSIDDLATAVARVYREGPDEVAR